MRSKFTTFILFLIMLILIGVIGFFFISIFYDMSFEEITEKVVTVGTSILDGTNDEENSRYENITISGNIANISENESITYSNEGSIGNYFYEQLSSNQKIIYNALQQNKENMKSGTYVIEFGETFSDILSRENGNAVLEEDYQSAIESYLQDNPDVFYLDISKLYMNIETTKKTFSTTYNVYLAPPSGSTYFRDEFSSQVQVERAISQIEAVRDSVLQRLTGNTYQDLLIIHDYLVDNITYDQTYNATGSYSIYGALVTGSCVCEGYAEAFKYLANSAGIPCEIMQGTAQNSAGETERHAWNCVEINNRWYYVDATWDDPIIVGNGRLTDDIKYRYFLKGKNDFEQDHFLETQLSDEGKNYTYPTISSNNYE